MSKITLGVVGKSTTKLASEKAEIIATVKDYAEDYVDANFTANLLYTKQLIQGTVSSFELPVGTTKIHEYLCSNVASLLSIDLTGATHIGDGAFRNCYNATDIDVENAVIKSLGAEAFSCIGADRENPSSNPLVLDFRKSSFKNVGKYTFGSASSSHKLNYTTIKLPNDVRFIDNYAFQYADHCDIYFHGDAPVLTGTNAFANASNTVLHASWRGAYGYKHNTNWASRTDVIYQSFADDFENGETLPAYDRDGYELTWYSDAEMTTSASTADGESIYYWAVGDTKAASRVHIRQENCTVLVKDGSDNIYDNDHPIPYGTEVTVTVTGASGMVVFNQIINGDSLTSGDTWTASSGNELYIDAIYYDGENLPVSPILANNSPSVIAAVFARGEALDYWDYGDELTITLTNGTTRTYMIADDRQDRYLLASGNGYANGVLMQKYVYESKFMNSTNTNVGGWAGSNMCLESMGQIYALFPEEWKAVIKKVQVSSVNAGNSGTLASADCDLFLPSSHEVLGGANARSEESSPLFGYFAEHTLAGDKIWKNTSNQAQNWWLRSPLSGYTNYFVIVYTSGAANYHNANGSYGVVPCFCL